MKLATVEAFVAVATLGHFRRAAERLNTTQPNISARIADLERDVGGPLFTRTRAGAVLTPAGRHLLPFAEAVLEAVGRFSAEGGLGAAEAGTLRLAVSETIVNTLLPGFIAAFAERFPRATVDLTVDSTTNQRRLLLERSVDLAFLMGPVSEYEVVNRPLIGMSVIWCAAPGHPVLALERPGPAELARWPVITYAANSRPFAELIAGFREAGVRAVRRFTSNSLNASLAMTEAGLGISTLPEVFARPYLAAGTLAEVEASMALAPLAFTASYTDDPLNRLPRAAAGIACAVAEAFAAAHLGDQKF